MACVKLVIAVVVFTVAFLGEARNIKQPYELDELKRSDDEVEPPVVISGSLLNKRSDDEVDPPVVISGSLLNKRGSLLAVDSYPCFHGDETVEQQLREECLYAHNKARSFYYGNNRKRKLQWDEGLAETAQKHAEKMAMEKKMFHSNTFDGENVAMYGIGMKDNNDIVVGAGNMIYNWLKEEKYWDYEQSAQSGGQTGHFTQMIWKATKKVGCGLAHSQDKTMHKSYLCCQYSPGGNRGGLYEANIPEPRGELPELNIATLNTEGRCDYSVMCKKYKRYCNKMRGLSAVCGVTCPPKD